MRPAARRWMAQPGLALATTRAPVRTVARSIGVELALPDGARQLRLQRAVRAAGAAAQAVVVELHHVGHVGQHRADRTPIVRCTWRRWHGSWTMTGRQPTGHRRQPVQPSGQPLVDVEDPGAERPGRLGAEQVPVVLQRRAAARPSSTRIGASPGKAPHDPAGQPRAPGG